jgi:hypothetical protein
MVGSSTSVDVAVIGTGHGLSLAAHSRARDVEHRTYHPAHHLARYLLAVLARFQPAPWVPSYDLEALS